MIDVMYTEGLENSESERQGENVKDMNARKCQNEAKAHYVCVVALKVLHIRWVLSETEKDENYYFSLSCFRYILCQSTQLYTDRKTY